MPRLVLLLTMSIPFMTTFYLLMATSSRITSHHKAQIISNWFLEHDNEFKNSNGLHGHQIH